MASIRDEKKCRGKTKAKNMGGGRKNTSDRLIAGVGGSKEAETNVAENSGRETKEPKDLAELRGWIATEVRVSGGHHFGGIDPEGKGRAGACCPVFI